MKAKILFLVCSISLMVIIYGCANEPDNIAISSDGTKFKKPGKARKVTAKDLDNIRKGKATPVKKKKKEKPKTSGDN